MKLVYDADVGRVVVAVVVVVDVVAAAVVADGGGGSCRAGLVVVPNIQTKVSMI